MVGMVAKRTLGPKGQIVVPKDLREHLGLKPGSVVVFEVEGKKLILRPEADPESFVEEFCSAPKKLDEKIDLKKLIDEQLEERHGIRRY